MDKSQNRWEFEMKSDSNPSSTHNVVWELRDNGEVYTSCTCPAGQKGRMCKHRWRTMADVPAPLDDTGFGRLVVELEKCDLKYNELSAAIKRDKKKERDDIVRRMHEFLPEPPA